MQKAARGRPVLRALNAQFGALAALVFAVLLGFTAMRAQRHPEAWLDDRRHPVRHAFIATLPIAAVLLATVAVALTGASVWAAAPAAFSTLVSSRAAAFTSP